MRLKNHHPYLHHLIQLDVQNLVELGLTHTIPENDDVVWFPLLGAGVKVDQELPEKSTKSVVTLMPCHELLLRQHNNPRN